MATNGELTGAAGGRARGPYQSPRRSFLILTAVLFVSEVAINFSLPLLHRIPVWLHNLLDAGLMVVLAYPALHLLVLRPLRRHVAEREKAEQRLQRGAAVLELMLSQTSRHAYLEALVKLLRRWCGCDTAGIRLVEPGGRAPFVSSAGLPSKFLARENGLYVSQEQCPCMLRLGEAEPDDGLGVGGNGAYIRNRITDIPQAVLTCGPEQEQRPCVQAGYQSVAYVPLRHGKAVLGSIHLADPAPEKFGPETVELIESLAPFIGEACLRLDAEDRLHESEERFRTLFERHQSVMLLIDPDSGAVADANPAAAVFFGRSREELRALTVADLGILLSALRSTEASAGTGAERGKIEVATRYGGESQILEIYSTAVSVRGRTLLFSIMHDVTEQRRMEQQIVDIAENEQQRLGRDLHDGLGQHLTATAFLAKALGMKLAAGARTEAEGATRIVECVNEAIVMTRQLARGLCPVDLTTTGLTAALTQYAAATEQLFRIRCTLVTETEFALVQESAARHCYRIVQEAVTNAVRHGKPRNVEIRLSETAGSLAIAVQDDGAGMPESAQRRQGMGLNTMAFRAKALGGRLSLEQRPGGGTVVTCVFPKPAIKGQH